MSEIDCNQVLEQIEAYIDGEVEVVRFERIEAHINRCHPCLQRVEFQQRLKAIVSSRCCGDDVPQALVDRVRSLCQPEDQPT